MVFENTSAHRASLRRWSWCRWRRNCWNVDGRQLCCPVTASVKQFWRFILVFLLTLEAMNKIFSLPLGQAKMSHKDYRIEEKFGKTERGKKRLDHSMFPTMHFTREVWDTRIQFSNIRDLPTNILINYLLNNIVVLNPAERNGEQFNLFLVLIYYSM